MAKLKKNLGLFDIFCLASGAMISSGLFILPGIAYNIAGPSIIISYLLSALLAFCGVLSIAELSTAMPKAGGDYFFIVRTLGPAVGTISGILSWFALSLKSSFALIGMSAFLNAVTTLNPIYAATLLTLFFIILNIFGVKEAGFIQVILVLFLLILLAIYFFSGVSHINFNNFKPFFKKNILKTLSAAGFVFVSYGGILKIATVSEEIINPKKNIPLGMLISLTVVGLLYFFSVSIVVGILPKENLTTTLTPLTDSSIFFLGNTGKIMLSIAAILAFVSTANAGIMAASRYPLALSRDKLLPDFFSKISQKSNTPYISILTTGAFIILMLYIKIEVLVKAASTVLLLTYILTCFCVIILRESKIKSYQPSFKSPFYPYIQIAGILGFIILIYEMGELAFFISILFMTAGFFTYWFYGRKNNNKEFALIHLIEKILPQNFDGQSLEEELRTIVKERDSIKNDALYTIIEKSEIFEINEKMNYKYLFDKISINFEKKFNKPKEYFFRLFKQREEISSSVIQNGIAIPHIIIEGKNEFNLLVMRSKQGIIFPNNKLIDIAFILCGTMDNRYLHLKTLAFIAKTISDNKFKKQFLSARNNETIKSLLLLYYKKNFQT
jgi:amino acid transporter